LPEGVLVITLVGTSTKTPEWEGMTDLDPSSTIEHTRMCEKEITKHECSGEKKSNACPKQTAQ